MQALLRLEMLSKQRSTGDALTCSAECSFTASNRTPQQNSFTQVNDGSQHACNLCLYGWGKYNTITCLILLSCMSISIGIRQNPSSHVHPLSSSSYPFFPATLASSSRAPSISLQLKDFSHKSIKATNHISFYRVFNQHSLLLYVRM